MTHPTTAAIAHAADDNGKFPQYTSVGSYTLLYLTADDSVLCAACVNGENGSEVGSDDVVYDDGTTDPQWTVTAVGPYYEGPTEQCEHCGGEIESSYGDPDAYQIKLDNTDREDGTVLITCNDRTVAEEMVHVGDSRWEAPADLGDFAYAVVMDHPGLEAELEREGYDVDAGEYWAPDAD